MTEIHNCYKRWGQRGENHPSGLASKPKSCLLPVCSHEIKTAGMWTRIAMILVTVKLLPKVCLVGKGRLLDAKIFPRLLVQVFPET